MNNQANTAKIQFGNRRPIELEIKEEMPIANLVERLLIDLVLPPDWRDSLRPTKGNKWLDWQDTIAAGDHIILLNIAAGAGCTI
ncbi:hypothetical protein HY407_02825 [Candidatus Gottesmanbacteria bacterium]|nr:hypothetical protein [Candidatus Gottesmanbacteria bacterium]